MPCPAAVGYPEVLASGSLTVEGEPITWMTSRRLSGTTLLKAWPDLGPQQRDRALRDVAGPLRTLHALAPPANVAARLGPPSPSTDPQTIIGTTIVPLPLDRVRQLVAPAADQAPEHRSVIADAWAWLIDHADLLPRLDDPADAVTHGDLHLDNIWWDGERVTGLLDLEWVRWGPAWLDLVSVRDNALAGDEFSRAPSAPPGHAARRTSRARAPRPRPAADRGRAGVPAAPDPGLAVAGTGSGDRSPGAAAAAAARPQPLIPAGRRRVPTSHTVFTQAT